MATLPAPPVHFDAWHLPLSHSVADHRCIICFQILSTTLQLTWNSFVVGVQLQSELELAWIESLRLVLCRCSSETR